MLNKEMMKEERKRELNLLISKYNFYLQDALYDYIKNKICIIKNNLKNGNVSERDRTYFEGVCDTCKEIMEITRRKK